MDNYILISKDGNDKTLSTNISNSETMEKPTDTKKKEKPNDEHYEKYLKLERLSNDLTKKQQSSEKIIHFLKCKLEVVQEKYDLMKKNFSKEKFIGVIHKNQNINNSESSLSIDLDSPPKNPVNNLNNNSSNQNINNNTSCNKQGVHLVSLQERRNQIKLMSDKTEEEKNLDDMEHVVERFRTESLDSGNFSKVLFFLSEKNLL